VIVLLVLLAALGWWFASRRSTGRRRPPHPETTIEAALVAPAPRRPLLVGPPAGDAVIEMDGVTKLYGRRHDRRAALDGLDLSIPSGGVFGVLGQNGAGKTTALRCLLGLVRPTSGTCRVLGADSGRDLYRVAGRIGALIEAPGLAPTLSGRHNLALLGRLDRIGPRDVERAMVAAGLAERADDPVATYSLGMRQRLGVAAALLRDPEVVILDEPANGLDPAGIADIRTVLISLAREGRTVVVSSHLLGEVERTCDRVAVIDAGRCVAAGQIRDLLATAGAGTLVVGVRDAGLARCALLAAGIDATLTQGVLRVSWPLDDAAHVTEVLAAAGMFVSELVHEQPSLEAVFFGLTSRDEPDHR
jgi:ABC-2 type transport system ATP-binding protein